MKMKWEAGNMMVTGRITSQAGSALVMVLAIVTAVLLIGGALFVLGTGEADIVEYSVDSASAFYLAEAGQERARAYLQELAEEDPPSYPTSAGFEDEVLGQGEYDVTVTKVAGAYTWLIEYEIVAMGEKDGATSTVTSLLRQETFAQYVYYTDELEHTSFTTGDSLDGRVHVNEEISIDGAPWFGMKVTSHDDEIEMEPGSDPTFEDGYELGVDEVPFPEAGEIASRMKGDAQSGGLYGAKLKGGDAYYQVELGRNGAYGTLSYRAYEKVANEYFWSGWTDIDISSLNGTAWFEEPIEIEGTLDGQITIGSKKDIWITNDILYAASTPGMGPDSDCDDILGLVAKKDIIVADNADNRSGVEIHGYIMALDESFEAENHEDGPPRGDLTIWGGCAQEESGELGTFDQWGPVSGYSMDYHTDRRYPTVSPPGYPQTDRYIRVSWTEGPAEG